MLNRVRQNYMRLPLICVYMDLHLHSLSFSLCVDEIRDAFIQFGGLTVDWPHEAQSKVPPKGDTPNSMLLLIHHIIMQVLVVSLQPTV